MIDIELEVEPVEELVDELDVELISGLVVLGVEISELEMVEGDNVLLSVIDGVGGMVELTDSDKVVETDVLAIAEELSEVDKMLADTEELLEVDEELVGREELPEMMDKLVSEEELAGIEDKLVIDVTVEVVVFRLTKRIV